MCTAMSFTERLDDNSSDSEVGQEVPGTERKVRVCPNPNIFVFVPSLSPRRAGIYLEIVYTTNINGRYILVQWRIIYRYRFNAVFN